MLNIARQSQAYQQAQQINPLQVQQQQALTQGAQLELANKKNNIASGVLTGLENSDAYNNEDLEGLKGDLNATKQWGKAIVPDLVNDGGFFDQADKLLKEGKVKEYKNLLANVRRSHATPAEQYQAALPSFSQNASGQVVTTNRATGQIGVPGAPQQPANLTRAESEQYTNDVVNTKREAQESQPRIATLETIKGLSKHAFTGTGGGVKEFSTGVLNALGIPLGSKEVANTQELAKNAAILQLAGGNTDLALKIAEVANPHSGMNQKAINDVVNQLSGIERMKQARAQYLLKHENDPMTYNRKAQNFNSVNDYRLFQDLTEEEAKEQASRMTPAEKERLIKMAKKARLMGVLPNQQSDTVEMPTR